MKIEISTDKSTATIDGVEYELKQKGKKISEWLQELPDGYRELALANYDEKYSITQVVVDIETAVDQFCDWDKTPQGTKFWIDVKHGKKIGYPPLPKPKFEVWKPKVGERCYWVGGDEISLLEYFDRDYPFLNFQTYEKAEEFVEKMQFNYEVEMFIKKKNEGWLADYKDVTNRKYAIYAESGKLSVRDGYELNKYVSDEKVFKSREIGEEIIEKFDNEKLIKWWI